MTSSPSLLLIGGDSSLAPSILREAKLNGFETIVTSRKQNSRSGNPAQIYLDVESLSSVEDFIANVKVIRPAGVIITIGSASKNVTSLSDYFQTQFTNMFLLIQLIFEELRDGSDWFLVYVSSRSALHPSRDAPYSAVKSGLAQAIKSLSLDLTGGQKAFSVAPGLIAGSSMYNDMPSWIKKDHEVRARGGLLSPDTFAEELFRAVSEREDIKCGSIIELGPRY